MSFNFIAPQRAEREEKMAVWLPKRKYRWGKGNYVIIPEWLARAKRLAYSSFVHIPEPIEPECNQEPIDELRY